ncbi:hypothetical protein Glove_74g102 [Diversispora epigaea]|uniref:HAT C-terminal dimerisation domain-containing protein n=1 Tax=Diversispora epigaea TaxID=1348612 RepID=A0A397J9U5_9GLOM|nr:hypothetical protein Glove_74g102 [Diversispora epigaea]
MENKISIKNFNINPINEFSIIQENNENNSTIYLNENIEKIIINKNQMRNGSIKSLIGLLITLIPDLTEVSEDFNFLENNKNALNLARQFVLENIEEEEELIDDDDELEIINPNIINTEINKEIEIEQTNTSNLSPCVVIDTINRKIQRLIQIDKELNKLGVCQTHFMFDQNRLYQSGAKSNKDVEQRKYCKEHSWEIAGKQIHMACIAQKGCNVFQEFYPIIVKAKSNERARGHLYVRPGKGKIALDCKKENMHLGETSLALELMSKWISYVAQNESIDYQEKVLTLITPALQQLNSKFEQPIQKPPSLFVFRYIFNDINEKVEDKKPDDCNLCIWATRICYICCNCFEKQGGHLYVRPGKGKIALDCKKENMHLSETSLVLELMNKWILYVAQNESIDYQEKVLTLITPALQQLNSKFEQPIQKPPSLFVFRYIFNDINEKVEDKKPDDWYHIGTNLANTIWINRKYVRDHKIFLEIPQCLKEYSSAIPPFLYKFFEGLIYILLFKRHQIANERQKQRKQLIISKEIDSKKVERITTMLSSIILTSSFTNTQFWLTRSLASLCRKKKLSSSLHQVLESVNVVSHSIKHERKLEFKRMSNTDPRLHLISGSNIWNICVIDNIDFKQSSFSWEDETIELNEHNFTIGLNEDANKVVLSFEDIILQLLSFNNNNNFNRNFNIEIINKKITEIFSNNSHLPPANIVILEAGNNPNSDEDIKQSCDQYFKDLNISTNRYINICCDEAIFRRIMLTFSSYGIYNFAALLGVKFLDKLEQVVDYRSTCRVLDLIWSAVVWYCFFEWTSYWKGHRVGIRTGNTLMQLKCLEAFAPLFLTAGKNNYMKSVVQYLSIVTKYPSLLKLLHYAGSVNLTRDNHYFAFDEALETFGVKFIKQNITGNVFDNETLKRRIKAAQTEHERMNLLIGEFVNDITVSQTEHAINSQQEVMWTLIDSLTDAFENPIPTNHLLFKNCKELTTLGCKKLIESYEQGKQRLIQIYKQEVLHIEPIDTKGRRAKGIVVTKVKDIKETSKKHNQTETIITNTTPTVSNTLISPNISTTLQSVSSKNLSNPQSTSQIISSTVNEECPTKRTRHIKISEEIEILTPYLANTNPTDNDTNLVLTSLLHISNHWTKKKVRDEWHNNKKKLNKNKNDSNIIGRGHYEAICKFCNKTWKRGIPKKMAAHLCNECTKVHASIRKSVLNKFVKEYNSIPSNETNEEIENSRLSSSTSNIQEFFENVKLPAGRKKEIDRSLIRAFIMCGFPFSAVENPFFIEFLKQLNSGYDPPSSDTLSGSFLDVETANINLKIENELEKSKNLTLGMDGWTNPNGSSIWNYVITTSNNYEYLYKLDDLSSNSNIWKDLGHNADSCKELLAQLRNYYLHQSPYDGTYSPNIDTPYSWWMTCIDFKSHLKTLALKLFSITPNSAGCERIFSSLGWFYGKRRHRLSTNKLELMAKIHRYYLTQAKKELPYVGKNYSEDEIRSWINRAYDRMIEDDSEDIDIDSPLLPEPIGESNERTDIELELERLISIEKVFVIINNSNENLEEENSSMDESNIDNEREDYDPALFAADYLSETVRPQSPFRPHELGKGEKKKDIKKRGKIRKGEKKKDIKKGGKPYVREAHFNPISPPRTRERREEEDIKKGEKITVRPPFRPLQTEKKKGIKVLRKEASRTSAKPISTPRSPFRPPRTDIREEGKKKRGIKILGKKANPFRPPRTEKKRGIKILGKKANPFRPPRTEKKRGIKILGKKANEADFDRREADFNLHEAHFDPTNREEERYKVLGKKANPFRPPRTEKKRGIKILGKKASPFRPPRTKKKGIKILGKKANPFRPPRTKKKAAHPRSRFRPLRSPFRPHELAKGEKKKGVEVLRKRSNTYLIDICDTDFEKRRFLLAKEAHNQIIEELTTLYNNGFTNENNNYWKIEFWFTGDWKYMALVLGINGPIKSWSNIGNTKGKVRTSLLPFLTPKYCVPDKLHLMLRIVDVLLEYFFLELIRDALVFDTTTPQENISTREKIEITIQKIGITTFKFISLEKKTKTAKWNWHTLMGPAKLKIIEKFPVSKFIID